MKDDRDDLDGCAAAGESTLAKGDFSECIACRNRIRWDLTEDRFWGFRESCPKNLAQADAMRAELAKGE